MNTKMDWQKEILDWLAYSNREQSWLANELGVDRQSVWHKLNRAKRYDDVFFQESIAILKLELKSQGKKLPDWYDKQPEQPNPELKSLIKSIDYLTNRILVLEAENERLSQEIESLRLQAGQISE